MNPEAGETSDHSSSDGLPPPPAHDPFQLFCSKKKIKRRNKQRQDIHQPAMMPPQQRQDIHQPAMMPPQQRQDIHQPAMMPPQQRQDIHQPAMMPPQQRQDIHQPAMMPPQQRHDIHQPAMMPPQQRQDIHQPAMMPPQQRQDIHQTAMMSPQLQNIHQPAMMSPQQFSEQFPHMVSQSPSTQLLAQFVENQARQTNLQVEQMRMELSSIRSVMMNTLGVHHSSQFQAPFSPMGMTQSGMGYSQYPNFGFQTGTPPPMQGFSPFTAMQVNPQDKISKKKKKAKKTSKSSCKPAADLLTSSTSSEDSDDSLDSERYKRAKRGRTQTSSSTMSSVFTNPNSQSNGENDFNGSNEVPEDSLENLMDTKAKEQFAEFGSAYQEAAKFYQAGRKNLIWQKVRDAEHLKETESQMDAVTLIDKFIIPRGPESYIVGNKRKRKLPEEIREQADKEAMEADDDYATDSTISSGGFSDTTKGYVAKCSEARRIVDSSRPQEKNKLTGQNIMKQRIAEMDDKILPNCIARILLEEKKTWHLFVRTMKVFGREYLIKTFLKTLKIERLGGIYIKNQKRRRTPGGVFLYLVRHDERLSLTDRDSIFSYDKEKAIEERRVDKGYQKKKMFDSITSKLREPVDEDDTTDIISAPIMEFDLGFLDADYNSYMTTDETETLMIPIVAKSKGNLNATERELVDYSDISGN